MNIKKSPESEFSPGILFFGTENEVLKVYSQEKATRVLALGGVRNG